MSTRPWAFEDDAFLLNNKDKLTHQEFGEILNRSNQMVKRRIGILEKDKTTIEKLRYEEKYIIDNHKLQSRAELAKSLNVSNAIITFRVVSLDNQGKLKAEDVLVKKYKPSPKGIKKIKVNLVEKEIEIGSMQKEMEIIVDHTEGAQLNKVKVEIGKTYEVKVNDLRENNTKYTRYFKGILISETPSHITLKNNLCYCESFSKVNIAIGDCTIKEVIL